MTSTAPIVLGIVGNPRCGNTELLIEEVPRRAREAGARTAEATLCDLDIGPCFACGQYVRTDQCDQKDDAQTTAALMSAASIWILGIREYRSSPTAQSKSSVNRRIGFPKDGFAEKHGILVVLFADSCLEVMEAALDVFRCGLGFRGMKHLDSVVGSGRLEAGPVKKRPELLAAAYEAGKETVPTQDRAEPGKSKEG